MKAFILDIIPKIIRYSQQLANETLLTSQHWVISPHTFSTLVNLKGEVGLYYFNHQW